MNNGMNMLSLCTYQLHPRPRGTRDMAGTMRGPYANVQKTLPGYAGACSGDVQNVARGGRGV